MRVTEQPALFMQQRQDYNMLKSLHKAERQAFKINQRTDNKIDRSNQREIRKNTPGMFNRMRMKRDDVKANRADLRIDKTERNALKELQDSERKMVRIDNRATRWQSNTYENNVSDQQQHKLNLLT